MTVHRTNAPHDLRHRPRQALRRPLGPARRRPRRRPPARCSGCSVPTGPGRRPPSASSPRCSRPDEGSARVAGYDVATEDARVRARIGARRPGRDRRRAAHRPRQPRAGRPPLQARPPAPRGRAPTSCSSASSLADDGRPARAHVLRRHAPPARSRRQPGRGAAGAVPRRADHRARPALAQRAVGRPARARRRRHDAAAHHAVPRGGRPARRPHRRDRRRARDRARHARRAEGARRRRARGRHAALRRPARRRGGRARAARGRATARRRAARSRSPRRSRTARPCSASCGRSTRRTWPSPTSGCGRHARRRVPHPDRPRRQPNSRRPHDRARRSHHRQRRHPLPLGASATAWRSRSATSATSGTCPRS